MGTRFASGKHAIAECDRCAQRYKLSELRNEYVKLMKTNILVCPECWSPDHPQLMLGMYPISDPQALRDPRPDKRTDVAACQQFLGFTNEGVPFYAWLATTELSGTSNIAASAV